MKDIIFDSFQNNVDESLLRHKSVLDLITKYGESSARVNRAIAKAVTNCGCVTIQANKQSIPQDNNCLEDLCQCLNTHLHGELCDTCRDVIEREMGNNLFYLTSLCNVLDINLYDVFIKESNKIETLGKFNFR